MDTETKHMTVEKMDDAGHGLARIATLSAVDHDGDTYAKGAFSWTKDGEQWVPILPAHNRTAMPLGKARVFEDGDAAYAELHLNLNTDAGRDWHATLKFDLEKGGAVQEWSYGFSVIDHAKEQRDGQTIRVLKRLNIDEVSPVVRGAGIGTRTLSLKAKGEKADELETLEDLEALEDAEQLLAAYEALAEREGLMVRLSEVSA